ncbi:histidine kinase [Gordonia amarae]|uniref:Histidine kinase n=2 Tax=Gordonia amarae TaxID=36821 RepID=A0A857L1U2_9ACTN|nr:histidine kinase [Gordonia amarae]MCS3880856.1 two-component system sensor histidine kinase DesK [Gordonia amarae]QHN19117.1 histidine kinase [Gordonia amarae]QHN23593.1 histidine kinase [Gordonia amarae]QHN32504.1 histidine kinase [Gordonia amarae]QHN41252.1 histidine kinase [Gordonia amarae]
MIATRLTSWWRHLPTTERYRFYSRVSLQVALAIPILMLAVGSVTEWHIAALIVVGGVCAIGAVEFHPTLAASAASPAPTDTGDSPDTEWRGRYRKPVLIVVTALLVVLWPVAAIAFRVTGSDSAPLASGGLTVGLYGIVVISLFRPRPWLPVLAVSAVSVLTFAGSPSDIAPLAAITVSVALFIAIAVRLTVWTVQVIDDLERAKSAEARLRVAEERLRFSRDLHDVVGRGFSAIAVKGELASALLRAGDNTRAAGEVEEIRTLAVESMEQMRTLVRGYRQLDLAAEIDGAAALLRSAGCELSVEGSPSAIPSALHDAAAWVVREGTTNIVKHSTADEARLILGSAGITLRNNGIQDADPAEPSGLRGLAERLDTVGATLDTSLDDGWFGLHIRWDNT